MPLQGLKCYIPLKWACCLLVATAKSSATENDRFVRWTCCLFKENFNNLLFNLLITGGKAGGGGEVLRIFLTYEVVHYHKNGDSEEYSQTYHKALKQTLFVQKYWQRLPILRHSLSSSIPKQNITLVISKPVSAFPL